MSIEPLKDTAAEYNHSENVNLSTKYRFAVIGKGKRSNCWIYGGETGKDPANLCVNVFKCSSCNTIKNIVKRVPYFG